MSKDKSETPRTDAFSTGLYNSACSDAAGMGGRDYSPEEAYDMALGLCREFERELAEKTKVAEYFRKARDETAKLFGPENTPYDLSAFEKMQKRAEQAETRLEEAEKILKHIGLLTTKDEVWKFVCADEFYAAIAGHSPQEKI